jgi:3-oxoacyl-(acyl-carrier-protein) synthase/thioesterase domain-containing protein/acyl carrier protein
MQNSKIAIIGMSGRFPDADSVEGLFKNCLNGIISVRKYSDSELIDAGVKKEYLNDKNYIKYGSFVKDIDKFDNSFFKVTQVEANITDPQHRIFMKCAWESLEDANYSPDKFNGKVGVFASSSLSTYLINNVLESDYYKNKTFDYSTFINNDKDFLPTKVSYRLGLNGPSIAIQSGCSSALVATHYACQSLTNGESDIAIVGGVSISVPQKVGYHYKDGSTFSMDGQIRPFDSEATGMIKGNGCGVVVLKELNNAIKDHDYIYAVIDSSVVNNDGKNKVGYTAPSVAGQTDAIKSTINKSGIDINKIKYIETHGTGTKLGDPIEIRALSRAYDIDEEHKVIIGSIKANIGHLDAAAGIVGLIKTAMILNKGIIPKSVNFESPNPQINFNESPFYLETKENILLNQSEKNYAAVSSFGIGGTNVHMILEDYKQVEKQKSDTRSYILPLSAKSESALDMGKNNIREFLKLHEHLNICDVAFSLCFGRSDFKYRYYLIASSIKEAIEKLSSNEVYLSKDRNLDKVAQHWKEGESVSWEPLFSGVDAFRVPLPTYPFEEKSFWINASHQTCEAEIAIDKINNKVDEDKLSEDETINEVVDIWSRDLDMEIKKDDDFFDIGGESLIAIDIISDLNKRFELNLETNILSELPTPQLVGNHIYKLKNEYSLDELENISKIISNDSSDKNLFLIHPAGGSTYCYNILSKYLDKDINIYAISFPQKVSVDLEIKDLAKIYAKQITQIQPTGELYIGGYSFGGNVALEIASQIKKEQRNVKKIFMIDSIAPEVYTKDGIDKDECVRKFPFVWNLLMGKIEEAQSLMNFEHNKDLDESIDDMKKEGSISNKFSNMEIKRTFNTWVSNHKALSLQNKDIKVDSPIVLFCAKEKMPGFLYEFANMKPTDSNLWSKHTSKDLEVFGVEGNHFSMMLNKEYMKILASNLNREIKKI